MAKILSKFGEQQLVMVNYACGFSQSETGKYFERIMSYHIKDQSGAYICLHRILSNQFQDPCIKKTSCRFEPDTQEADKSGRLISYSN